ncbi:MerR family transcriptional regulator [Stappia sp. GBMRC 2046]|uniref:MerR family transcriptional regulator n=1 Tax=Stappia sediminis TaxID=2692190 RepID=A0A7X3LWX2_9HYPH|nr:MerR family transcriptional regulator [Stappia sediminis]MXN66562.1 MerR family transcriptional regulator [Stappia sediminis]
MFAIGEASRRSGVGIETIRYYEREGIVPRPERSANGRRVYSTEAIGLLKFLKNCRSLGFSLADAKALLDLSGSARSDCDAVLDVSKRHLRAIGEKIAELRKLEAALEELTANCSAGNTECPMLDTLRRS